MLVNMSEAAEFLKGCEDAVILTHQSPDGDCTGAGFGLKDILSALGIRSRVECCDPFPKRFDFLTSEGCGEDFEPKSIIAVDIADEQLLGCLREKYEGKIQLCIDHHVSNKDYAEKTLLRGHGSAACEVVYDLAQFMGVEISKHCAECLYTGIATDTGCFKFDCTTIRSHLIAAELKEKFEGQINFAKINRNMFDVKSIGRIKLESKVLDIMEYYLDNRFTLICVTNEMLEEMDIERSELDGCASLPLQIEGVEVGVLMKPREDGAFKISMRSANDVNVSEICQTLGGGGHAKAAGCLLKCGADEAKKILIEAVGKALN